MGGLRGRRRRESPWRALPANQATNIPGLYAAGECDYPYHGANRLGANSLLSCIFAGQLCGPAMVSYASNSGALSDAEASLAAAKKKWTERFATIRAMNGRENPYQMAKELGDVMTETCTVVRYNDKLAKTVETVRGMKDRWKGVNVLDASTGKANQALSFVNQLWNMLELAIIATSALKRDECRGSHYKPDFSCPSPRRATPSRIRSGWRSGRPRRRSGSSARWRAGQPSARRSPTTPSRPRSFRLSPAGMPEPGARHV